MMFLKPFLAMALCLAATTAAKRHMREIQLQKEMEILHKEHIAEISTLAEDPAPKVYWETVSLPIDHTGKFPELGNFSNRFWVMDQFYEPGGPVFSLDTGESNGAHNYLGYLTRNTAFFYQYLKKFKGIGIVWEHRYYGESLPFPVNLNTTSDQLQHLTAENALKDFVVFANEWQWKNYTVNPKKTPWIVVGGSYPGMRAAMLRYLYPETVFASYASSAPIEARTDMSVYWEQAYRGLIKYGLKNCTAHINHAVTYIDSQLARPYTAAKIKQQFLGRTAERGSNAGFADTLQFPLYNWQSAGVDDTLREFCDHLAAGEEPADPLLRGKYYSDRWASWPAFVELVNQNNVFGVCEGSKRNDTITPNCLLDERFDGTLGISWTWQYCTEWGFYQPTNIGRHALGSKYNSLAHQQDICYRQFPDGLSSGLLPKVPRTRYINGITDGWYMRPSNVMWTGGEFDPWRTLSPLSQESFSPRFQLTDVAPECGVSTAEDTVFGYLMKDSQHCFDFRVSEQAKIPQAMFADALTEWLKCFGKQQGS